MTKVTYLNQLDRCLSRLPFEERQAALRYYVEYFDDAGVENEQKVLNELGSPQSVAAQILADYAVKETGSSQPMKKGMSTVWIVILAIFAAPIALPLALAVVMIVFALFMVLFALLIAAVVIALGGVALLGSGFAVITQSMSTTIAFLGAGLACCGLGILLTVGMVYLIRACIRGVAKLSQKMVAKRTAKK